MPPPALGVLGGTFDPIHCGHLRAAEAAAVELDLSRVLLVPAGDPWQKATSTVTSARHRYRMTELAVADHDRLAVSRVDVDRDGSTYTVDTLADLRASHGSDTALHFLLGADAARGMGSWRQPDRLLGLAHFEVLRRPGVPVEALPEGVRMLRTPQWDISSTEIRHRVAASASIEGLVPPAVADYIRDHELYAATGATGARRE